MKITRVRFKRRHSRAVLANGRVGFGGSCPTGRREFSVSLSLSVDTEDDLTSENFFVTLTPEETARLRAYLNTHAEDLPDDRS